MSYHQNSGHYHNGPPPPPHHYQQPPPNPYHGYDYGDDGDDGSYATGGYDPHGYGYGTRAHRSRSSTSQRDDELFMGSYAGSQYQTASPPQPAYNPQQYAPSHANSVSRGGSRPYAAPAPPPAHQAYNPAAYQAADQSSQYGYIPMPSLPSPPQQYPTPPMSSNSQFSGGRAPSSHSQRSAHGSVHSHSGAGRTAPYTAPAPPPPPAVPDEWSAPGRHPSNSSSHHQYDPSVNSMYSNHSSVDYRNDGAYYASNPLPPTPNAAPPPPQHAPRRSDTTGQHPQSRPLPAQPHAYDDGYQGNRRGAVTSYHQHIPQDEYAAQNALYEELEGELTSPGTSSRPSRSPRIEVDSIYDNYDHSPVYTSGNRPNHSTNGHLSPQRQRFNTEYSDESDAEAAAGLAAMRMADEQDAAEESRRASGGSGLYSRSATLRPPRQEPLDQSSDSDYANIDMGLYGGGFSGHMSYGGSPDQLAAMGANGAHHRHGLSVGSAYTATSDYEDLGLNPFQPFPSNFPPRQSTAQVDTSVTGGLEEPSAQPLTRRRLSYDEGDETGFEGQPPLPPHKDPPEMYYHPAPPTSGRPLPPPPPGERALPPLPPTGAEPWDTQGYQSNSRTPPHIEDPEAYTISASGQIIPRSTSMQTHSTGPREHHPVRAKTDAEEKRRHHPRPAGLYATADMAPDLGITSPPGGNGVALDLPALPAGKRFNPAKLTPNDFKKCTEPWALGSVLGWIKSLAEGEADLKEQPLVDGLVRLFTHKVPTMNVADAETLSAKIIRDMYAADALVHEEEWLRFGKGTMSGVIFQLTGNGCYTPKVHEHHTSGRCYSYHCQRTVKKIDLSSQPSTRQIDDWATFYKVKKEDVEGINKKEVERQNILHEIVTTEDNFMESCNVVRTVYRDAISVSKPPVIAPRKLNGFLKAVFGKIDAVQKANADHLLPQLKYRQQEQGPWVSGFSDIFREWIRKARGAYIDYAAAFPNATFLVRREMEKNVLFKTFLDQARSHKASNKLGWDNYLKSPIGRLQHYTLLLDTVLKKSVQENEELANLRLAINEIKAVAHECDARVGEMQRKVDLADLQSKLILRPGMQRVELNLDHLGRELIFQGDLQRVGTNRFNWVDTHALLFDHYLVLAKKVSRRDDEGGSKYERYDVSRLPIPMDLLVVESLNEDPVMKQAVKGIGVATVTKSAGPAGQDPRSMSRTSTGQPGTPLQHTNTSVSSNTSGSSTRNLVANTNLEQKDNERIIYPFRIKHLGKEEFTLYANSSQNRQDWCDKIIEAKTKHAQALFQQNAEPFRLRVIADSAFAYETGSSGQRSVLIEGTPLDRAIEDVEHLFSKTGRPSPVCRAKVNCATAFTQPDGKAMLAVGTDFGVYITDANNPRGWARAISTSRVTQVAVLEEFSIFLLISDKQFIAYHLDVVCPAGGVTSGNDSARKAPQKLSGQRDVGFFATGKMKDRTLVFYKKRDGISSVFKVLEPVYQKSSEKKSRLFRSGRTDFFRDYDDFYIAAECYGINLFHSSLAVGTSKGFEILTLDKKQAWSVPPDLKQPHVATIASRLAGLAPLGMFRLSDQEFLLCYEECAIYVNKHGDISRSVIMEFVGKARSAALYGPYVLLFDQDFVEIRNAQNGRLRQVIAAHDVKLLDDALAGGTAGLRSIKIALQHPQTERLQMVVELLLNEGQKE